VDVYRERQFGSFAGPLDHSADAHATERMAALIDENVGRLDTLRRCGADSVMSRSRNARGLLDIIHRGRLGHG